MDWGSLGYAGACGVDDFPLPGKVMRQKRTELAMSQGILAGLLGASRSMVVRMEKSNHGLDSIATRRQVSKVLGIAPVMIGVVSIEEVASKATSLYSTTILKRSFHFHRESYFSGGNVGGTAEVEEMVQHIFDISTTLGHTNKEVLSIISQYAQLGVAIAREEQKYAAAGRFAQMCLSISR